MRMRVSVLTLRQKGLVSRLAPCAFFLGTQARVSTHSWGTPGYKQVRVTCYRTKPLGYNELIRSIDRKEPLAIEPRGAVDRLKIAPQPFSSVGAARWPFYAVPVPGVGAKCVVKRFKTPYGEPPSKVGRTGTCGGFPAVRVCVSPEAPDNMRSGYRITPTVCRRVPHTRDLTSACLLQPPAPHQAGHIHQPAQQSPSRS